MNRSLKPAANDDEEEEILSLERFKHLDVLRFEVDLTSGSFAWALQVLQMWIQPEKSLFELIIYEDMALESTGERCCTQRTWGDDPWVWVYCDSWQKWWEFITDVLLDAFSPNLANRGTRFGGDFMISFVSTKSWSGVATPSSPFRYTERVLDAYQWWLRWHKLGEAEVKVQMLTYEAYRYSV